MRTPSVKTIKANFPGYDAKLIKRLLTDDDYVEQYNEEHNIIDQHYSKSWRHYYRLLALNHALEMYGVENVQPGRTSKHKAFCYLNTGDAYWATLVQFWDSHAWRVTSRGDIS